MPVPYSGNLRSRLKPPQRIALAMLAVMIAGTIALSLPVASYPQSRPRFIDSLFTAASALSVTGLITQDTPTFWTPFGQLVILCLIQVGGFGVMALATLLSLATARKIGLQARMNAANETKSERMGQAASAVRGILIITIIVETTVAVVLGLRFHYGYEMSPGQAAWNGIFHSVSAFNNAGFALFSDSLMGFAGDPLILLTISFAVIVGGIGFPVIFELLKRYRMPHFWSMHTKLVLSGTAALLAIGWLYCLLLEWNNPDTLGPMPTWQKILGGFFQSVTSRTAGFNAMDTGLMEPGSWLGTDILMFIGASPAGTGGGLKVTTLLVIFFIMRSELRADRAVLIFGKRLSRSVHRQAITVMFLMIVLVIIASVILLDLEGQPLDRVLFEVVSAISTTGLSTGITASLHDVSKLVLVTLMFIGRVGPITLGTALAIRHRPVLYTPSKERPIIG
ncbi:TrkH family potassium uptake protein [Dermabacteraceae bacterium P13077]